MSERTANVPGFRGTPLRIGEMLVQTGLIDREQAGDIARYSVQYGVKFGEAAIALGLIDRAALDNVLASNLVGEVVAQPARVSTDLMSFHQPESAAAEDIRALRNALTLRWFQHPDGGRALSVISAERREGRSLMAANLAIAFAQVGVRTLLIDADMRHPIQHRLFGLDNRAGLSGYLNAGQLTAAHYFLPELETLSVIPVGALPPSPQELLLRPSLASFLETASLNFEVILVDTPSARSGSDYQIVAKVTRGAVMIGQAGTTRTRDAARMINTCEDIGVKVVGGAMTRPMDAQA